MSIFSPFEKAKSMRKMSAFFCRTLFTVFLKNSFKVFYLDYSTSKLKNILTELAKDDTTRTLNRIAQSRENLINLIRRISWR